MFVKYIKSLPKCKVAKHIKLSAITNTERLSEILCSYKGYLHSHLYTLSHEELKTIFYTKNNSIYFYISQLGYRVLLHMYYDQDSKKYSIFGLDKLDLSVQSLKMDGFEVYYKRGGYYIITAADEYDDPIYEEVGYYADDNNYKISNLVKAPNGNLYCTCEVDEDELLIINLNNHKILYNFAASDIQFTISLANAFLIIIKEPFDEDGSGNTEILVYIVDLANENIIYRLEYNLEEHLEKLKQMFRSEEIDKLILGATTTSHPDGGIDYTLQHDKSGATFIDRFYYTVNISTAWGDQEFHIIDSLKILFKFDGDEINITISTGENPHFDILTFDGEPVSRIVEIEPNSILMSSIIKVENSIDLSKTQLYYEPKLSKFLDVLAPISTQPSTGYDEEFISKAAESAAVDILKQYRMELCGNKEGGFTYRYYLDEKREHLYVFINCRCRDAQNDNDRTTYLLLLKCKLRKNGKVCSVLLYLGPYRYRILEGIIGRLLSAVFALSKCNKVHLLEHLYSEANRFKYDHFYVYRGEMMFKFYEAHEDHENVGVVDVSYNRLTSFAHMKGINLYSDDDSFKILKNDSNVVLCYFLIRISKTEREVIKIPIVVSEMDLVKSFQVVNPWVNQKQV